MPMAVDSAVSSAVWAVMMSSSVSTPWVYRSVARFHRPAGRDHGQLLLSALRFQNPHGGQIVFHTLKRHQNRLPVTGHLRIISRAGLLGDRAPLAAIEESFSELRAHRPHAAGPIEQAY